MDTKDEKELQEKMLSLEENLVEAQAHIRSAMGEVDRDLEYHGQYPAGSSAS